MSSDSIQDVKVEEISVESQRCELGEGPHWDVRRQSLYYVDINAPAILRFDHQTGKIHKASIGGNYTAIGFIVPVDGSDDKFVVGANHDVLVIQWNGESEKAEVVEKLTSVDDTLPENRINDGKVDQNGVLFFGTLGDEFKPDFREKLDGSFFSFSKSAGLKYISERQVAISNGITWDEKRNKMFYIDSLARNVKEYDYNQSTSDVSNGKVLIDFNESHRDEPNFVADGMTIDENGRIYVCTWGGARIIVIDPATRTVVREIKFPTDQVTSAAFGGPNLDILFVTTAGRPKPQPAPAGGLFKVTNLGVRGLPMHNFKL